MKTQNNKNNIIAPKEILPTLDDLCNIENWKGKEHFSYMYSDFIYCKDYQNNPNNRLVTLRRFPIVVNDNGDLGKANKKSLPLAKAITWIDETNKLHDYFSSQTFTVTFSYELKTFGGINPKAAMLDIIANLLYVISGDTFTQSDVDTYLNNNEKITNNITSILSNMFENPIGVLSELGKTIKLPKYKNSPFQMISEPNELTGNCHLMVGNPFNPIFMIGDLTVTGANLKFADDNHIEVCEIPNKLDVEITIEHGKSKSKNEIENMFNNREG